MGNCVDGTFCMDDGNMLLGSFLKGKFQKENNCMYPLILGLTKGYALPTFMMRTTDVGVEI